MKYEEEYKKVIEKTLSLIRNNKEEWENRYKSYIEDYKNKEIEYKEINNLSLYTSISVEDKGKSCAIYRCYGIEVGRVFGDKINEIKITFESKTNPFGDEKLEKFLRNNKDKEVSIDDFNKMFSNYKGLPNKNPEHVLENIVLREIAKTENKEKISSIRPIRLNKKFFQFPTPLSASKVKDNIENIKYSGHKGGGIDILARVGNGFNSKLAVIELKDEFSEDELPKDAIKQSIVYGTFISELLCSKSGVDWWKKVFYFNEDNQQPYKKKIGDDKIIRCYIMMPDNVKYSDKMVEEIEGEIKIDNGYMLQLRCIKLVLDDNKKIIDCIPKNLE